MPIISDGFNTYGGNGGETDLINPDKASMKIGEDFIFRFDGKSGILEISMSQSDIDTFSDIHGGMPIKQMVIPTPLGGPIIQNVKEIRPLPSKEGGFLLRIAKEYPAPSQTSQLRQKPEKKSLMQKLFSWF